MVWPVKLITATSGDSTMASPTSEPAPVTRLIEPGGKPASAMISTRSVAQSGVSLAGLKTTVLPVTSAGIIFQHGNRDREIPRRDDPDDADRLADAHRPLVGQLGRDGVAEAAAALAGHQERDVDPLLDVAAGFDEDLAHLQAHGPGEAFLVEREQLPEAVEDLAPARRGRAPPAREGGLGRSDGPSDVGGRARLEAADDPARIGGIVAVEGAAGFGIDPVAGDEELVDGRVGGIGLVQGRAGMEAGGQAGGARLAREIGHRFMGVSGACQARFQARSKAIATEPPPPRQRVARP